MRSLALVWLLTLTACSPDSPSQDVSFDNSDTSGSLKLPLSGIDAEGNTYRLRRGTFELNGAAMMTLAVDRSPTPVKALRTPLPSGAYQAFLRDGFQLVEVMADGSERPVQAVLSSANPARFDVETRSDQELRLTFRRGSNTIAMGGNGAQRIARRAAEQSVLASASKPALGLASEEPTRP